MIERQATHNAERLDTLVARSLAAPDHINQITRESLWNHLSLRAIKNRLGGALINRLDTDQVDLPDFSAMTLRNYREHLTAKNDYQLSQVLPVLQQLNDAGIPFLILKGAALNAVLFDAPGVRGMDDIDVLIQPDDAARADAVLKQAGCSIGEELLSDDFYPRYYYEREYFTNSAPPVKIDLHVRPFRPLRYAQTVPNDALWDDPQSIEIQGVTVHIPNPTNMLIHLCVHAACHGAMHVRWLHDIYRWCDGYKNEIDINALTAKCRKWRLTLPTRRALEATQKVFNRAATLQPLLDALTDKPTWQDRLALWQAPHDVDRPAAALLASLLTTPGWRFRLGYARTVLVPSEGHLKQIYPYRHPGWKIVAHITRIWTAITRPFRKEEE